MVLTVEPGTVHPHRRQRARGVLRTSACASRTTCSSRRRAREPDGGDAEDRSRRSRRLRALGAGSTSAVKPRVRMHDVVDRRRRPGRRDAGAGDRRRTVWTSSRSTRARRATTPRGDRSLALSHGARLILERLGVWDALCGDRRRGDADHARSTSRRPAASARRSSTPPITASPALGYVVSYRALQDGARCRARARAASTCASAPTATGVDGTRRRTRRSSSSDASTHRGAARGRRRRHRRRRSQASARRATTTGRSR